MFSCTISHGPAIRGDESAGTGARIKSALLDVPYEVQKNGAMNFFNAKMDESTSSERVNERVSERVNERMRGERDGRRERERRGRGGGGRD